MVKRIAVLLSNKGTGSNFEAIAEAIDTGKITNGEIVVVVSNAADAYGLVRAKKRGIPTIIFSLSKYLKTGRSREQYDGELGILLKKEYRADLVVLAGWILILTEKFLSYFPKAVINLHPGLLPDGNKRKIKLSTGESIPAIRGLHTDAAVQYAIDQNFPATGSSVHFVTAKVDKGKVILRGEVRIKKDDTVDLLYERIKKVEHKILPQAIEMICRNKI